MDTKIIVADFSGGPEIYDKIRKEMGDLDVGVLGKKGIKVKVKARLIKRSLFSNLSQFHFIVRCFSKRQGYFCVIVKTSRHAIEAERFYELFHIWIYINLLIT